jgi:hypothetical protein
MADLGIRADQDTLVLWKGRDFKWAFDNLDPETGDPIDFPAGRLFFELQTGETPTEWDFSFNGSQAVIKVESDEVAQIPKRTKWQLVFLPDGEVAGGDPITAGLVEVVG